MRFVTNIHYVSGHWALLTDIQGHGSKFKVTRPINLQYGVGMHFFGVASRLAKSLSIIFCFLSLRFIIYYSTLLL